MASGAILGVCPYCGEFIWEDEDYRVSEYLYHSYCSIPSEVIDIRARIQRLSTDDKAVLVRCLSGILDIK